MSLLFFSYSGGSGMAYQDTRYCHNLNAGMMPGEGPWDIPAIRPEQFIPADDVIDFSKAARCTKREKTGVHFFIDDYRFERLWHNLGTYMPMLAEFQYVMTPDFSMFTDWPAAVQIYNHYRKHYIGARLQDAGVRVYPTINWSDKRSYEWCFDGEPAGGTVCVSSVGTQMNRESKRLFLDGYMAMMDRLKPETVVFYGGVPKECRGNIVRIKAFQDKFAAATICE